MDNDQTSPHPLRLNQQSASSIVATALTIIREEAASLTSTLVAGAVSPAGGLSGQGAVGALREPARSLAEMLVKVLEQHPDRLAQLIDQAAPVRGQGQDDEPIMVLRASRPVAPGDVARIALRLQNEDNEADECTLCATDLAGPAGHRIPAAHVRTIPQLVHVPGGRGAEVQLEVRIPSGTPVGRYTGLVQADDGESLRALVQLTVHE